MRRCGLIAISLSAVLTGTGYGQGPPPPKPIIETEIRENSTKIRGIELERIKREAHKAGPDESDREREVRFRETKKRFESIQKSQSSVIKAYTTGKTINYSRINESANDMTRDGLWLDVNLFGAESAEPGNLKEAEGLRRDDVRDLIIRLDKALGRFVQSPVFKPSTVLDKKMFQEAQQRLREVISLSRLLSAAAKQ